GPDQRGHGRRRGGRPPGDCPGDSPSGLALGLFPVRRGGPVVDALVAARILRASAASAAHRAGARRDRRSFRRHAAAKVLSVVALPLRLSAVLGSGAGKISERCRLVLLSLLAAEVSLRCARL